VTSNEDSPSFDSVQSTVRDELQPTPPIPTAAAVAISAGAWLIPGLGHILLKRWVRGLIFMACVVAMFVMGLAMNGKLYGTEFEIPLQIFALIANLGAGLPYLIAKYMGLGVMTSESYDYGTTFLWVAGLLNFLIVLDAFDIAKGRKP
jgi:uncharacterized protein DUF6677